MTRSWYETEEILRQFRDWLSQTDEEVEALDAAPADASPPCPALPASSGGLLPLTEAFTALRHELKLQTKSARGLEESVTTALAGLDKAVALFQSVTARETQAAEQAAKPLVASLVELDEALERGAKAITLIDRRIAERAPQELVAVLDRQFAGLSGWRRWLAGRWHREVRELCREQMADTHGRMFSALMEGYQLTCARLRRALSQHQIRRIECLGRAVDPATMNVVELVEDPAAVPETVVAELRPGYTWRGTIIRYAEVRAVRRERPPEPPVDQAFQPDAEETPQ